MVKIFDCHKLKKFFLSIVCLITNGGNTGKFIFISLFAIEMTLLQTECANGPTQPAIPMLTCTVDHLMYCLPDWSLFDSLLTRNVRVDTGNGHTVNRSMKMTVDSYYFSVGSEDTLYATYLDGNFQDTCSWFRELSGNRQYIYTNLYLCGIEYIKQLDIITIVDTIFDTIQVTPSLIIDTSYNTKYDTTDFFILDGLTEHHSPNQGFSSVAVYQIWNHCAALYPAGDTALYLKVVTAHELGGQMGLTVHDTTYSSDCIMVEKARWDGIGPTGLEEIRDTVFCSDCISKLGTFNP